MVATPTGMLTKKIHCQPIAEVMMPPTSGPTATAAPVTAPNTPKAVPRSRPWNAWAISARDVANIIAPPIPCTPRARFSISDVLDRPHTNEEAVKTTSGASCNTASRAAARFNSPTSDSIR